MAKTLGQQDTKPQTRPSQEEIAKRAYELFEQSGRKPGRDLENWLTAEAQLLKAPNVQARPSNSVKLIAKPVYHEPVASRA